MKNIGTVSSEGGPLLVADAIVAQQWRGATFDDEDDYERACELLTATPEAEGKLIPIADGAGLIWDMGGPGVSDVFLKSSTHLMIVRTWLEDPNDTERIAAFAGSPLQEHRQLGSLRLETGIGAILWAPESGEEITPSEILGDAMPIEGLSVGGAGLLVKLESGDYRCLHDEISVGSEEARRLHLIKA